MFPRRLDMRHTSDLIRDSLIRDSVRCQRERGTVGNVRRAVGRVGGRELLLE